MCCLHPRTMRQTFEVHTRYCRTPKTETNFQENFLRVAKESLIRGNFLRFFLSNSYTLIISANPNPKATLEMRETFVNNFSTAPSKKRWKANEKNGILRKIPCEKESFPRFFHHKIVVHQADSVQFVLASRVTKQSVEKF